MSPAKKKRISKEQGLVFLLLAYAVVITFFAFQKDGSVADSGSLKEDAGFKLNVEVQSGSPTAEQSILLHPEAASLVEKGYTYEITEYGLQELDALARKYPVVYGGLENRNGVTAVQFTKGNSGKLLIYDARSGEVLRTFNTQGITLN